MTIRLYIDTASREEAEPVLASGLCYGLTTNPLLLHQSRIPPTEFGTLYEWATDAGAQEVFFQTWGVNVADMVDRGRQLRNIGERVVVKVPATRDGVTATATLAAEECPTLLTAVYSAPQALLAGAVGATYIAPYLGRMGDAGRDGLSEVTAMQRALRGTGSTTQILAASVRSTNDMVHLASEGVRCFTISPGLVATLFADPLTQAATEAFEQAARNMVDSRW